MRKLNPIITPIMVAAMALGAASPVLAHESDRAYHEQDNRGRTDRGRWDDGHRTPARAEAMRSQIDQLQQAVTRNDWRNRISEREAAGLRRDVWRLREDFRRANRDGLSDREFRGLQGRIDTIRSRLHMERHDDNGYRGDHRMGPGNSMDNHRM